MVNDGEVGVYKRGICQNLNFGHRWYIFPRLRNAQGKLIESEESSRAVKMSGNALSNRRKEIFDRILDSETYTISS